MLGFILSIGDIFLIFALVFLLVVLSVFIVVPMIKAERQPAQSAFVKVVKIEEKIRRDGTPEGNVYITLEFPDGSEKEFRLPEIRLFNAYKINDTGTLTYKEYKNNKNHHGRVFISLEKDTQE
jgi:hypothetical protein